MTVPESDPCSTPTPSTDDLRARYHFPPEPMRFLSLGDLSDLLMGYVAGELSEGLLSQMTGLDRMTLRGLHQDAITRSDQLCKSYRDSEDARFRKSRESSGSGNSESM